MVSQFLKKLESEIVQSDFLRHPFFDWFRSGKITRAQLRIFTGQQYHFSISFPRCIAALYSVIPDYRVSRILIDHFLLIEAWGTSTPGAHSNLFRQWLRYLGLNERMFQKTMYPETKKFLATRLQLCSDKNYFMGLGSLAYGHELINAHIFQVYTDGLRRAGIQDNHLSYFRAHTADDEADYRVLRAIIVKTAKGRGDLDAVKRGTKQTLAARRAFLDRLYPRLLKSS